MLVSRGAINGTVLGGHALAAGTFLVPLSSSAEVEMPARAAARARRAMSASTSAEFEAGVQLATGKPIRGRTNMTCVSALTLVRRVRPSALTNAAMNATIAPRRRVRPSMAAVTAFEARMPLRFRFLHLISLERGMVVEMDDRRFDVSPGSRTMTVISEPRVLAVAPDRGVS